MPKDVVYHNPYPLSYLESFMLTDHAPCSDDLRCEGDFGFFPLRLSHMSISEALNSE